MIFGNADLLDLETTQVLLRYVSECDPRGQENGKGTTKGGYLKGRVKVPFQGRSLLMRFDLVPTEDVVQKIRAAHPHFPDEVVMAHPNIIHNIRFRNGKRNCHLEPVPYNHSTKLEYMIDQDGNIRIRNRMSELDEKVVRPDADVPAHEMSKDAIVGKLEQDITGQFFIQVGKKDDEGGKGRGSNKNTKKEHNEMNLIPLQPKQKARAKAHEANITDVIVNRLGTEYQKALDDIMSFYQNTKKGKNAINLKNFRLRVQFYDYETKQLWQDISDDIKDTGNKNNGAMDIFDVTNQKSCCKGGRKVNISSEWNLAVKDVEPRLQVYDADGNHIESETLKLNQPSDEKAVKAVPIVKNMFINFLSPKQDYEIVRSIQVDKGLTIKVLLYRKSDDCESPKKFNFRYIQHIAGECPYCDKMVDSDSPEDLAQGQPRAQPNRKKRINPTSKDTNAKKSKMVKEEIVSQSPEHNVFPTYDSDDSGILASPLHHGVGVYNWENNLEETVPIATTSKTLYTTPQSPVDIGGGSIQELSSMSSNVTVVQTLNLEDLPITIIGNNQNMDEADHTWTDLADTGSRKLLAMEEDTFPDTRSIIENDPIFKEPPVQRVSVIVNSDMDMDLNTPLIEINNNPFMGWNDGIMADRVSHDGAKMAPNDVLDVKEKKEEKETNEEFEQVEEEEEPELVHTDSGNDMMVHLQLLMIVVLMLMVVSTIMPGMLSSTSAVLVGGLSLIFFCYRYRASEIKF